MKTSIRTRTHLHVSRTFHPPPAPPPTLVDVLYELQTPPSQRTEKQNQIIFRYLITLPKLNKFLETASGPDLFKNQTQSFRTASSLSQSPKFAALASQAENPRPDSSMSAEYNTILSHFGGIQTPSRSEGTLRLEEISRECELVTLSKGDVLFFEGDDPDGWYIVLDGSVEVIIRLFLIAEDCLYNTESETTEYAQLMDRMDLETSVDKLRRVNILHSGCIFGQHSYILHKPRNATISALEEGTLLMKIPGTFFQASVLLATRNTFHSYFSLVKNALPRLRDDQISLIASLAEVIDIRADYKITAKKGIGKYLCIVKSGSLARSQIVDFTDLSFRTISAPFETLELHFPDGPHPVHTDDLGTGSLFSDPSIDEMNDLQYSLQALVDTQLLLLDLDYFKIVAGEFEVARVKADIQSKFSNEEVIKKWIEAQKQKLWLKFKERTTKEAHKSLKAEAQLKNSTYAIRVPKQPHALKPFVPKKVVPNAPKGLR